MATNYFGELAQVRANGANARLSLLSNALENRRQEQQNQRKTVMGILADPEYTTESKKQFEQTGNLSVLQSARQVEAQAKAAQEAQDKVAYRDILFKARRGDGTWDAERLRQITPEVPPSLMNHHVDLLRSLTPPAQHERNIDPRSPEGIDAEIKAYRMKALIDAEVGGKKNDKPQPQYDPQMFQKLQETKNRMDATGQRLSQPYKYFETLVDPMFGAPRMEPDSAQWTPAEYDSMFNQLGSDSVLAKGLVDLQSGKNTWEAQAAQELLDQQLLEEARKRGITLDSMTR